MVSLSELSPGDRGIIRSITPLVVDIRRRLLEMGMINGTTVEMVRFAPLGDPIEVRVRGYRLSLRKSEAQAIMVQRDRDR